MLQKDISRIMHKSGKDMGVRAVLIGVALLLFVLRVNVLICVTEFCFFAVHHGW